MKLRTPLPGYYFGENVADDDRSLVRLCRNDDASAIRALVERFQGDVFGLCFRMIRDRHEAEDIVQEVFLRVFRSLHRWDPSRPLKPWVLTIAVNRCRTWMGRRGRRPEPVDFLPESLPGKPPDDDSELRAELELALQDLKPEQQTAFTLFHEQGLPYETIAEMMSRPVGTIKTWLHRARLQLLDTLTKKGLVEPVPGETK